MTKREAAVRKLKDEWYPHVAGGIPNALPVWPKDPMHIGRTFPNGWDGDIRATREGLKRSGGGGQSQPVAKSTSNLLQSLGKY